MKWAKAQGGVTGYAHSASGLWIEPAPASKRLLVSCLTPLPSAFMVHMPQLGRSMFGQTWSAIFRPSADQAGKLRG